MPDPEIHIIDASGAGPLDWPIVAEEFYQAQEKGIKEIKLDIPICQKKEDILNFIKIYCESRRIGITAEELSTPTMAVNKLIQSVNGISKILGARPGAPSRGGDRG